MSHLAIMPVLIPLTAGALLLLTGQAGTAVKRTISLAGTAALLPVAVMLLIQVEGGVHIVYYDGNWPAPYGIALVVDRLSALMLVLSACLAVPSLPLWHTGDWAPPDRHSRRASTR